MGVRLGRRGSVEVNELLASSTLCQFDIEYVEVPVLDEINSKL